MDNVESEDDRPLAIRRKRRASTGLHSPNMTTPSAGSSVQTNRRQCNPQTPTKAKKRVRFSDPGPDDTFESSSTGITPFIKRTTLTPTHSSGVSLSPRLLAKPPRRRRSLPSLCIIPSSSGLPTPPLSGEIQFAPLRQLLDDRVKRRLRRNNLSEEINEINAEKRMHMKKEEELRELKEELMLVRHLGGEVVPQISDDTGNQDETVELENDICNVRDNILGRRSLPADPQISGSTNIRGSAQAAIQDFGDCAEEEDDLQVVDAPNHFTPAHGFSPLDATTQTILREPDITSIQDHIQKQTEHLVRARLELEYICPGETTLGLTTGHGNVGPILDALVDRLRAMKGQVQISNAALKTLSTQESNLRNQFNTALLQLDSARNKNNDTSAQLQAVTSRSGSKRKELELEISERQRSIDKLQHALESYRAEVRDLENLVTRLEAEHKAALTDLRCEMDEAVADLECHVVAETRGRREAEDESEQRLFRIRELEAKERELQRARNEKQSIVRKLEEELEKEKQDRACEVGALNVRVGELSSILSVVRIDLLKMEAERARLLKRVEEEKTSAAKALEKMRDEMILCMDHLESIREDQRTDAQVRGEQVTEHQGLLTPVSAVRFKDMESCEGYVEIRRGKTRTKRGVDSGIGILEEDKDEGDMM